MDPASRVPGVSVISPNEVAVALMAGFEPQSVIETVGQKLALVFPPDVRALLFQFRKAKERANDLLDISAPKGGPR